jgi:hypothetical protein
MRRRWAVVRRRWAALLDWAQASVAAAWSLGLILLVGLVMVIVLFGSHGGMEL